VADFGVTMVVLHLLGVLFDQVFSLPRNFMFNSALDLDFPQMVLAVFGRSEDTAKRKVTVGTSVLRVGKCVSN